MKDHTTYLVIEFGIRNRIPLHIAERVGLAKRDGGTYRTVKIDPERRREVELMAISQRDLEAGR